MNIAEKLLLLCSWAFCLQGAQQLGSKNLGKRKFISTDSTITDQISVAANGQGERVDSCSTSQTESTIALDLDSLPLPADTQENHKIFDDLEARAQLIYDEDQFAFLNEMSPACLAEQINQRYQLNASKKVLDLFNDHTAVINYTLVDAWARALAEEDGASLYAILLADLQVYKLPLNAACAKTGMTALMVAAKTGPLEFAQLLMAHGARLNKKDNNGRTAQFIARQYNHSDIANLLLITKMLSHYQND